MPMNSCVRLDFKGLQGESRRLFPRVHLQMKIVSQRISLGMVSLYLHMFLSPHAAAQVQQAGQVEWQDENFFTEADRRAIPTLAKRMGIQNPKRVNHGEYLPTLCPYAMIESAYSYSGHLRTHLQLIVHRKDWKCMIPQRAKRKRVGRWFADAAELETRREWKIEEHQWIKYVFSGDGVSYEDAELIILAIKHGQLVNRSPQNVMPTIDPMDITSIRVKESDDRTFEVGTSQGGSGEIYVIRINDRLVELLEVQIWMA